MQTRKNICVSVLCLFMMSVAQVSQASVVGYWPLDGDATASVGTSGTLVNTPMPGLDRNGLPNGALDFVAADLDYVSIAGGGGLDGSGLGTLSAWVKWDGLQDAGCCGGNFGNAITRQSDGLFSDPLVALNGADPSIAQIRYSSSAFTPTVTSAAAAGDGVWRHVALRWWGGGSELLIDGVSQGVSVLGGVRQSDPATPLVLGAWIGAGNGYSNTSIDDVAVFDDYLTNAQISDLANQNVTPLTVGSGTTGPMSSPFIPATATASSFYAPDNRNPNNAVNGNGLNGQLHNTGAATNVWLTAQNDPDDEFTVDFGDVYALQEMRFWNYNENANATCCLDRGIMTADILIAGADGEYSLFAAGYAFAKAPGVETGPTDILDLSGVEARGVKLTNITNYGDASFTGISEVQFYGDYVGVPLRPGEIDASIHSVTSELTLNNFDRVADHLLGNTGLIADKHSIVPDGTMWLSNGTFTEPNDLDPEIVFDMGEEMFVGTIQVWNYNEILPNNTGLLQRGVKLMDIWVAGDDEVFTLFLEDVLLEIAPGDNTIDFSQLIELGIDARFIKFDFKMNHGDTLNFYGLSEVKFYTTVIPEPGMLVISGVFGLLCLRRRTS